MISLKRAVQLTVTKDGETVFTSGELRVDFVVDNMVGNALNTSRITVYNLSPACVKTLSTRDAPISVKLEVGYKSDARLTTLFEGDLINIHHTPMFENTLTTLWCWQRGGKESQVSPKPAKTFTSMSVKDIATNIVQSLVDAEGQQVASISFDKVVGTIADTVVPSFIYKKSAQDSLKDLLDRYSLQYNLAGGVFIISNKLTKVGQEEEMVQVIQIDSGVVLIHPTLLKKPISFSVATATVTYELTPNVEPLSFMQVQSGDAELQSTLSYSEGLLKLAEGVTNLTPRDYYQILKVVHRGSCYTDEWETEIKGIIYSNSVRD